jgi:type IV secretory pathway TraG/TraD family ATPase VirD4
VVRGLSALAFLFGVLAIVFGVWTFAFAADAVWVGIKFIFYACVGLFILSLNGWGLGARSPVP